MPSRMALFQLRSNEGNVEMNIKKLFGLEQFEQDEPAPLKDEFMSYVGFKPTNVRNNARTVRTEVGFSKFDDFKSEDDAYAAHTCAKMVAAIAALMSEGHEGFEAILRQKMQQLDEQAHDASRD